MAAYAMGVRCMLQHRWGDAIDYLAEAARRDPSSARVRRELGRVLLLEARDDEALRWLEEAAALAPESSAGLLELAEGYRRTGDTERALDCLWALHEKRPQQDEPLILLHALLLVLEREQEGVQLFTWVALETRPDWPFAQEALGDFLLRTGRIAEAEGYYEDALQMGGSVRSLSRKLQLIEQRRAQDDEAPPDPGLDLTAATPASR